ncbi:MAG: preprotein translocase subunit SecE [Ruminococcaceae bacterium]|nr:preprotein translocase subunit SecE [Oscillospiraceae bacterium]
MKAKKSLVLFLVSCLCLTLAFCLSTAAEDTAKPSPIPGMNLFNFISLCVLAVVLVVVVVLCIIKRQKVAASMRAYKSEMTKITWFPWKSVWRSSVFVIVAVLAVALTIGLLDIAFLQAQNALTGNSVGWFSSLFGK